MSAEYDRGVIDAAFLRRAAEILRRRSKRPKSFGLRVLCGVLEGTAKNIEREIGK